MNFKPLLAIIFLLGICFSSVPVWVKPGVTLTYTVGSSQMVFRVLNVSDGNVRTEITQGSVRTLVENASADYGQYWFDNVTLQDSVVGQLIGDLQIVSFGTTTTIAGKQWSGVTLEQTMGTTTIRRIVDKNTGILLRQTADATGAPVVELASYQFPSPPAPVVNNTHTTPAPPPINTTIQQPPVTPPTQQPTQNTNSQTNQTVQNSSLPTQQMDFGSNNTTVSDDSLRPGKSFSCCGSTAFIGMIIVGAFVANKKN